ncbi:MAG: cytochrome c3 family protein [Betaproteobacteria bacterium]|nr:cytochrome c3 family protein [Betaproteobacteria bacterium]
MTFNKSRIHTPAGPLAVALFLAALLMAQPAVAQILGSKHDLTSATGTGSYRTSSTAEICVFCHTPHGGSASAPLWNKGLGGSGFTLYSSATLDSVLLPVGSISAACLSCHDGVGGLDNMINAPGSGGYTAGGASAGYTWTVGTNVMAAGTITNLGPDLANDHPVGAAYCGSFASAGVCKDPDFKLAALNRLPVGGTVTTGTGAAVTNGALTDQYWVDTAGGTSAVREKTDLLLYTRLFVTPAQNLPSVECASCHEPHNGGASSTPFLRISNAASALCTTCHSK